MQHVCWHSSWNWMAGPNFFQIDGNTYVFKLEIPEKLVGYHINELNLEQEFGLKLISLVQGKQVKKLPGYICL